MQTLTPQEIRSVSGEIARLPLLTLELEREILCQMSDLVLSVALGVSGGQGLTQTVLETRAKPARRLHSEQNFEPAKP